jgi:hypothetical protein
MSVPAPLMQGDGGQQRAEIMDTVTKQHLRPERSPLIVALALAVGLLAQAFGGPIVGLIGAVAGTAVGQVIVRYTDGSGD